MPVNSHVDPSRPSVPTSCPLTSLTSCLFSLAPQLFLSHPVPIPFTGLALAVSSARNVLPSVTISAWAFSFLSRGFSSPLLSLSRSRSLRRAHPAQQHTAIRLSLLLSPAVDFPPGIYTLVCQLSSSGYVLSCCGSSAGFEVHACHSLGTEEASILQPESSTFQFSFPHQADPYSCRQRQILVPSKPGPAEEPLTALSWRASYLKKMTVALRTTSADCCCLGRQESPAFRKGTRYLLSCPIFTPSTLHCMRQVPAMSS